MSEVPFSQRDSLVERICPTCTEMFWIPAYRARRGDGKFCSRACRRGEPVDLRPPMTPAPAGRIKNPNTRTMKHRAWTPGFAAAHRRYAELHPWIIVVRNKLCGAVRSGRLHREACQVCGDIRLVHGHHDDYLKPYDVIWLCPGCHRDRHNAHRRAFAAMNRRCKALWEAGDRRIRPGWTMQMPVVPSKEAAL